MIKEITLKNFLSYGESMSISLSSLNIMIGPNGSGKSNLIEAIDLLHNAPSNLLNPIRDGGGISEWIWKGNSAPSEACIETVFNREKLGKRNIRHKISFSSVAQRFEIKDEKIEDEFPLQGHTEPYFYYHLNRGRPYLNVKGTFSESKKRELRTEDIDFSASILSQRRDTDMYPELSWLGDNLSNITIYRDWNFGRYTAPRISQRADMPNKYLLPDCSNLGLVLNKLCLDSSFKKKIIQYLQELNPNIQDITVLIEGGTVQVFVQEHNMPISATRLSDGTLRLLCLIAVLCHPNPPPLICIEEPELGLHPDAIGILSRLLHEAAEKTQVVVTTHSAILVDYFTESPESVIVAEKTDSGSYLNRLKKEELKPWLENYRLGKLWLSGEIGGVRW